MPFFRAAVFDLDGTLLNTLDDLTDACNFALRAIGAPEHTSAEVSTYVGNGVKMLMTRALPPETDNETAEEALRVFKLRYAGHNHDRTMPYPGITELLERLNANGVKCGIVSNKNDPNVKDLAARYFPEGISEADGERPGIAPKPAPDLLLTMLEKWGIAPSEAAYIGDSDVDVITAKNAGMPFAGVDWGFRSRACLTDAGAKRVFSSAAALGDYLLEGKA